MNRTRDVKAILAFLGVPIPPKEKAKRKPPRELPAHCQLREGPGARRYEVTIPEWIPARLNVLKASHWAVERKLKFADACVIGGELRRAGVTRGKRRVGLVIVLGPRMRGGDPDAYNKSFLDGLVRCGALVDDNRQGVEILPIRFERQSVMGTRVIIEDLS
jgi:hypothetical protein